MGLSRLIWGSIGLHRFRAALRVKTRGIFVPIRNFAMKRAAAGNVNGSACIYGFRRIETLTRGLNTKFRPGVGLAIR